MTDGTPGWFRDPNDDTLARWHDGRSWTEHTLVIADQPPGVEPPPPQIDPEPEPEVDPEPTFALPRRPAAVGRELPAWFKVAGPLAVVALLVVAFASFSGDDDPTDEASTADTVPAALDDAIDAARRAGLSDDVSDPRAGALIERICRAAEQPTGVDQLGEDLGALPADGPSELRQQVGALGVGAGERCPSALEDAPDLVDDLQALAVTASATTVPDVLPADVAAGDGATDAGLGSGDGADGGDGAGSDRGGRTGTTRGSSGGGGTGGTGDTGGTGGTGGTGTTAAPTTTLPGAQEGFACSNEGAKARSTVTGKTITCQRSCYGVSKSLKWQSQPCPPPQTAPTQPPNQPPPAPPSTTTTTTGSGGP